MPNDIASCIKLFADDAKLFRKITNQDDCEALQNDIQQLVSWSQRWQMTFNPTKCQVLHLGSRNQQHCYSISQHSIESTDVIRDLGVLVDNKLSFQQHLDHQINKANRTLGIIRRTFDYLDITTLTWLYKAMVRPHLEYCNAIT